MFILELKSYKYSTKSRNDQYKHLYAQKFLICIKSLAIYNLYFMNPIYITLWCNSGCAKKNMLIYKYPSSNHNHWPLMTCDGGACTHKVKKLVCVFGCLCIKTPHSTKHTIYLRFLDTQPI